MKKHYCESCIDYACLNCGGFLCPQCQECHIGKSCITKICSCLEEED